MRRWQSWRVNWKLRGINSIRSSQEARALLSMQYAYIHVSKESWVNNAMWPQRQLLRLLYKSEPLEVDNRSIYLSGFQPYLLPRKSCWCPKLERHGRRLEENRWKIEESLCRSQSFPRKPVVNRVGLVTLVHVYCNVCKKESEWCDRV